MQWMRAYWLYAAAPGMALYAFEAARLVFFPVTRAPNASLLTQLLAFLIFYALFTFAPRLAFDQIANSKSGWRDPALAVRLVVLGLVLSAAHLLLLALLLRLLHSPPGWGIAALTSSFMEVWLGNAGIWLLVYAACCGAILLFTVGTAETQAPPNRIEVRHGERLLSLRLADIAWIESSGNYVEFHGPDGSPVHRQSLKELEKALRPAGFLRSHRKALVNATKVRSIRSRPSAPLTVELEGGFVAPLSRRRASEFRALLSRPSPTTVPPFTAES